MTAGFIYRCNVWDFNYSNDAIGGALPTGTILYREVNLRISPQKPTLALLEQGLETPMLFTGVLAPANSTFTITQNQQLEITWPPVATQYYQKYFVVIGVQASSMEDARKYWIVTLRRIEKAHSARLQ